MKRAQLLAPLAFVLAACGTATTSSPKGLPGGSDLQVTNKVILTCQTSDESQTIKVRQFKDANGKYGSDSLFVVDMTDGSLSMHEARVLAPSDTYWLLLGDAAGNRFDVRAKQTVTGQLLSEPAGTLTVDGSDAPISCQKGN